MRAVGFLNPLIAIPARNDFSQPGLAAESSLQRTQIVHGKRRCQLIEDRVVRYNDIDLNGHLNNTKYIDYITDLKDESFYKKHSLKSILVSYDKEIKEKEVVTLYMDDSDSSNLIKGKVNGINCFTAYIEYNKR